MEPRPHVHYHETVTGNRIEKKFKDFKEFSTAWGGGGGPAPKLKVPVMVLTGL